MAFFLPLGRGRFELYAEPPEPGPTTVGDHDGRVKRWIHAAGAQWRVLVDKARTGSGVSRFARWRDAVVCRLADTIDEQRTLWALRETGCATLRYPSSAEAHAVKTSLDDMLRGEQRHHGWWLAIDAVLFVLSGVLFFVPGPNIVAYYLGFRAFGHLQSWRGARRALATVAWTLQPSEDLAELEALAGMPHDRRTVRVQQIAEKLGLLHLPAFFQRAAR
ncbi:MAG: hypothetical protein AB7Q29_06530 [Vicinamibacterales bacterium]